MTASGKGSISATSTCLTGCYIHLARPTTTTADRCPMHAPAPFHTHPSFFLSFFLSFFPCRAHTHTHPIVTIDTMCTSPPFLPQRGKYTLRCKPTNKPTNRLRKFHAYRTDGSFFFRKPSHRSLPPAALFGTMRFGSPGGEGGGGDETWAEKGFGGFGACLGREA